MNLRSWLRRKPEPVRVKADDIVIAVPDSPRKWSELEETILAKGASRVECYDATGTLLRAMSLDEGTDEPAKANAASPEETMLVRFAELLTQASDASAARHADAFTHAFNTMATITKTISDRLYVMEKNWQAAMIATAQAQAQVVAAQAEAEAAQTGNDGVLGAVVQGFLQGQGHAEKPNGKKETKS